MSDWIDINSYGQPIHESAIDVVRTFALSKERGVIEIQTRPVLWERMCTALGETRPVTIETVEDKAAFVSYVAGRIIRVYAVDGMSSDFRCRAVPK